MKFRQLTWDVLKEKTVKGRFKPSTTAEKNFYRQLRKVAETSGHIVERHVDGVKLINEKEMVRVLAEYADALEPWAKRQAEKMLSTVKFSNKKAYQQKSKVIGKLLETQVGEGPTGDIARKLLNEQVGLIQSIPLEAGLRAQKIAFEAFIAGSRASAESIDDWKTQLGSTTEITRSRALLIARTETARANAAINQTRAQAVGSGKYRWHNSGDEAVRTSHKKYKGKKLQGMIFSWDDPPTLDDGMTGHPGTFPNCRCFAEPIFEEI